MFIYIPYRFPLIYSEKHQSFVFVAFTETKKYKKRDVRLNCEILKLCTRQNCFHLRKYLKQPHYKVPSVSQRVSSVAGLPVRERGFAWCHLMCTHR